MPRSIVMSKFSFTTITLGALALAACGGDKKAADSTAAAPPAAAPAAAPAAPAGPEAVIVSPKNNDTTGADVTVKLSKQGPVTIEKASGTKADGVGHYHIFLDTAVVADGTVIPPTNAHVVHIGTGDSTYTFKGLTPGPHQIIAVIGYGDHSAMAGKHDTVNFVVKK
jgi:6-phosphogluconolactonase